MHLLLEIMFENKCCQKNIVYSLVNFDKEILKSVVVADVPQHNFFLWSDGYVYLRKCIVEELSPVNILY